MAFDKSEMKAGDSLHISLVVTNSGTRDGDEVVQLYLKRKSSSLAVPLKELKAFKRISLKKGEVQAVRFALGRDDLAIWNEKNEFVVEPGEYNLQIGASSADVRVEKGFIIR
jgi:beta-glucosidase